MGRPLQGWAYPSAGQKGFPPNVVISLVGLILATRIGGMLGGIFRILDSQFEILQGMGLHVLDRKLDESLGKLATQDDGRRC